MRPFDPFSESFMGLKGVTKQQQQQQQSGGFTMMAMVGC